MTRLTEKRNWEDKWLTVDAEALAFDPEESSFRDIHRLLSDHLPRQQGLTVLEAGAFPGRYLWYFHTYFNYEPWGVEYLEDCALKAREYLAAHQVPARIIWEDFFDLDAEDHLPGGWDLVASLGLVEHFSDIRPVVRKHFEMAKPGGLVFISVPNHAGLNGKILQLIDKSIWKMHNCMSLEDLAAAVRDLPGTEILLSVHTGRMGFRNSGLYTYFREKLGRFYLLGRGPCWLLERIGEALLPRNKFTSPGFALLARKIPPG